MSDSGIPIVSDISKVVEKVLDPLDLTKKALGGVFGGGDDGAGEPASGADIVAGVASDPRIAERATKDFAAREAVIKSQARAAGVTRSGNEADLLGYTAPKRRTARRTLLGA